MFESKSTFTQIPTMSRRNNAVLVSPPSVNASYYANVFCRKRMITPLLIPPGLVLLLPPILKRGLTSLNTFSRGFGILCLLSSIAITRFIYSLVRKYAPTADKLTKAHDQMRYRLFMLVLICVCCFVRMVSMLFGWKEYSSAGASSVSFGTRYALGIAILSGTVALRFVTKLGVGEFIV